MAITTITSCCLNLPPPNSASNNLASSTSKTTQLNYSWFKNEKWRRQCVVGMAATCMIIGIEMDNNNLILQSQENNLAMAREYLQVPIVHVQDQSKGRPRWSDRRMCPPWRLNSLETVVPENLPRPSARRRWESIGHSKNAPATVDKVNKVIVQRSSNNCFTM